MVKEAMTSNPMMQSVYGALDSGPFKKTSNYEMPAIGEISTAKNYARFFNLSKIYVLDRLLLRRRALEQQCFQ